MRCIIHYTIHNEGFIQYGSHECSNDVLDMAHTNYDPVQRMLGTQNTLLCKHWRPKHTSMPSHWSPVQNNPLYSTLSGELELHSNETQTRWFCPKHGTQKHLLPMSMNSREGTDSINIGEQTIERGHQYCDHRGHRS